MESKQPETNSYPQKPHIHTGSSKNMAKSLISLALFILIFMLFLDLQSIFLLLLILFIHEGGHFIAMKLFNYEDVNIFFIPLMGAVTSGQKSKTTQLQRALVIMAGPIPGIIIGILCFMWGDNIDHIMVKIAGVMFVFVNMLNLIPIDPLDGGRLLETLFFANNNKIKIFFLGISIVILAILGTLYSFIMLFLGFIMFTKLRSTLQLLKIRNKILKENINIKCNYNDLSDKDYWRIREIYLNSSKRISLLNSNRLSDENKEQVIAPAVKNILYESVIHDMSFYTKLLFVITWICCFIIPIKIISPFLKAITNFVE